MSEEESLDSAVVEHNRGERFNASKIKNMFGSAVVYRDDYTGKIHAYREAQPHIEAQPGYTYLGTNW